MWRKTIPVVGTAVFGLAVLTLGAVFLSAWLMTAAPGRVTLLPAVAAGVVIAAWLLSMWWACVRLADYVDWCRDWAASPAREHIRQALGRPYTVEIDGVRVSPRRLSIIFPYHQYRDVMARAKRDSDR